MRANFQSSLFKELDNVADDSTNEIEILDFYLDMDALDCLCHCVSTLQIDEEPELPDLNETIDSIDETVDSIDNTIGCDVENDMVDLELHPKELEERVQATHGEFEVVWPLMSIRRDK
jgi:hypothetical protein